MDSTKNQFKSTSPSHTHQRFRYLEAVQVLGLMEFLSLWGVLGEDTVGLMGKFKELGMSNLGGLRALDT